MRSVKIPIELNKKVAWVNFRKFTLKEAFFSQDLLKQIQIAKSAPYFEDLSSLVEIGKGFDPNCVRGILFHTSRTGSSLCTKVLQIANQDTLLAEVPCFNSALQKYAKDKSKLKHLLYGLCASIQNSNLKRDALFIKTTSWNVLHSKFLAHIFPKAQIYLIYRDPADVYSSLLREPSLWMETRSGGEFSKKDLSTFKNIFKCCYSLSKRKSVKKVAYSELRNWKGEDFCEFFDLDLTDSLCRKISKIRNTYSKSPSWRSTKYHAQESLGLEEKTSNKLNQIFDCENFWRDWRRENI